MDRSEDRYYVALLALVALVCWIVPLRSSLWIDEAGTYWIAKDGFRDVIPRAVLGTAPTPGYFILPWLAMKLGGTSEIVMRIPSVLAMAGAAWLIYLIGAHLVSSGTGMVAAIVFACMRPVMFAAADARPYALAVLLLSAHIFMLLRWIETGRFRFAALSAIFAALTMYVHIVFAIGFLVPAVWALWSRKNLAGLAAIWAAVAVLCLPLAISSFLYLKKGSHFFAGTPTVDDLLVTIFPTGLIACMIGGLFLAYLMRPIAASWIANKPVTVMLMAWALSAPVLTFAIARFTPNKIFLPRYVLSSAPASALLAACVIRSFQPVFAQRLIAAAVAILAMMGSGLIDRFKHGQEDWRGAMAAVRSTASGTEFPVLVRSGFVEAESAVLDDPKLKDLLFAQLIRYPPAGRVIRLPYELDEPMLDGIVSRELSGSDSFLLAESDNRALESWFRARLASRHPETDDLGWFGNVSVVRFRLH